MDELRWENTCFYKVWYPENDSYSTVTYHCFSEALLEYFSGREILGFWGRGLVRYILKTAVWECGELNDEVNIDEIVVWLGWTLTTRLLTILFKYITYCLPSPVLVPVLFARAFVVLGDMQGQGIWAIESNTCLKRRSDLILCHDRKKSLTATLVYLHVLRFWARM